MTTKKDDLLGRREFLGALGAGAVAAGSLGAATLAAAQKADDKTAAPLRIIDFHNHYMGPKLTLTNLASVPPAARPYWEGVNKKIADPAALLAVLARA